MKSYRFKVIILFFTIFSILSLIILLDSNMIELTENINSSKVNINFSNNIIAAISSASEQLINGGTVTTCTKWNPWRINGVKKCGDTRAGFVKPSPNGSSLSSASDIATTFYVCGSTGDYDEICCTGYTRTCNTSGDKPSSSGGTSSRPDVPSSSSSSYVSKQYCYEADAPLISYYREYHNNPTSANWNLFIGVNQRNCCAPLISNSAIRGLYFDAVGNNIYSTYCAEPIQSSTCFYGPNSEKIIYDKSNKTQTDISRYANRCCSLSDAKANMGSFYDNYCAEPIQPAKTCFIGVNSYKNDYNNSNKTQTDISIYANNCCGQADAKNQMGSFYDSYCTGPIQPNKMCFSGLNSYKHDYDNSKKTQADVDKYRNLCCDQPGASLQMGDFYNDYCPVVVEKPNTCFTGAESERIIYEKSEKGELDIARYKYLCCHLNGAEDQMGSFYDDYCSKPNEINACFSGINSEKSVYESSSKTLNDITRYKKMCCDAPNARVNMGSFYDTYCPASTDACEPNIDEMICAQKSDSGHIYEANEKGINSNNLACLLKNKTNDIYSYIESDYINNKYCKIVCKEDVDLYFPGFGYNPNSKNEFLISAGQYFAFKSYINNNKNIAYLPTINQSRSCIVKSYYNTLSLDLYGATNLYGTKQSTGYYSRSEDALEAIYDLTKLIDQVNQSLQGETNQSNINRLNHIKSEFAAQKTIAEDSYRVNVNRTESAINQYFQCVNFENKYKETDYPKVDNFFYNEMKTTNSLTADALSKIKVNLHDQTVTPTTLSYCNESMSNCNFQATQYTFYNYKENLPTNLSGSKQDYLNSQRNSGQVMSIFDIKKSESTVKVSYTLGDELYTIKPTGLAVTKNDQRFISVSGSYTYNYLGYGLPVNYDTFGGKRYNYSFDITNLGIKEGNMMKLYKEMQQDRTKNSKSTYICNYEVSNQIFCTADSCKITCPDPLDCVCDGDCETITNPILQVYFRPIDNDEINPNNRNLGTNWDNEKGLAAKKRIEEAGDQIYAEKPMYSFRLDTNKILEIRDYNNNNTYASFDMICNQKNEHCESIFIKDFFPENINSSLWLEYNEKTKSFIKTN